MTIKKFPVKTGIRPNDDPKEKPVSTTIGIAEVPVFEGLEEMTASLGKEKVFALAQTQHGTNLRNEIRSQFTARPSDSKIKEDLVQQLIAGLDTTDKAAIEAFKNLMADENALNARVQAAKQTWLADRNRKLAEVAKRLETETVDAGDDEEAEPTA